MNVAAKLDSPRGWVGVPPSMTELGALLFAGTAGILFAGVGPLLLGALNQAGRLSVAQVGQAGTAELLAMGVAAGLTGTLAGHNRLRPLVIGCGLLIAALNLATTEVEGGALVAVRALAGLPSGALVWLMTAAIVRTSRPERWAAIYLTVQTVAQLLVAAALSNWVLSSHGPNGGFTALAVIGLATAATGLAVPRRFAPLPVSAEQTARPPSCRGLTALAVPFLFNAGVLAVWIYIEPLSRQAGHPAGTADLALALSLAAQVAGGALATIVAGRSPWAVTLLLSLTAMLTLTLVLGTLLGPTSFLAASAAFGFLWMFASPLMTPLVIDADPTRRAAVFGSGAALLGGSSGPFVASLVVSDSDVRGCAALGAGLTVAALAIVGGLRMTRSRQVGMDAA